MSKPTDTSKTSPRELLFTEGIGEAIEASERRGGEEMLVASVVPTHGSEALAALGFELGEVVAEDPIFRYVTAPAGWTREPGENPYGYWTYLVDPEGRRRVAMFYKAAFYDRGAHLHVIDEYEDERG